MGRAQRLKLKLERQPKETRRRSGHQQSVRLPSKRQFAVQDNAVEHVTVGEQIERSVGILLAHFGLAHVFITPQYPSGS